MALRTFGPRYLGCIFLLFTAICTVAIFIPAKDLLFSTRVPRHSQKDQSDASLSTKGLLDMLSANRTLRQIIREVMVEKLNFLTGSESIDVNEEPPPTPEPKRVVTEDTDLLIDRRVAEELSARVQILCWIPTREKFVKTRLKAVNDTWAQRCDKVVYFMSNPSKHYKDVVGVNITDSRKTLTDKTVFANKYIHRHYLEQFDWFLKADDDTYVIMENLKFLLSHFDPRVPGYIGCQFKHFAPQGYMSGGAGYLFNREGLKLLVDKGYNIPGRCRLTGGAEDIETGRCASKAGIRTLNQLDYRQRETFFPSNVYANAIGPGPAWARSYMRSNIQEGKHCCSELLVSFHYTGPKLMYTIDFLLYRVTVHGRRFMEEKADVLFKGDEAVDMDRSMKRRPYPGDRLDEYYQKDWSKKNTTIYVNPNL